MSSRSRTRGGNAPEPALPCLAGEISLANFTAADRAPDAVGCQRQSRQLGQDIGKGNQSPTSNICAARSFERRQWHRVVESPTAGCGPSQRGEMRANPERHAEIVGQRPDIKAARARDHDPHQVALDLDEARGT